MTAAETQQFRYQWTHMGPYFRHDLSVVEYEYPSFAAQLDSDLASLGLTPVAAASAGDLAAPADGKSRHAKPHRSHRVHLAAHPKHHHASGPRKDDNPLEITAANQYTDTLPQQLVIGFNQDIFNPQPSMWGHGEAELLDLNTGTSIPIDSATYSTYAQAVTYGFSTSAVPADGNYVAILHGARIASTISTLADGGDVLVGPGVSNVNTPTSTYGFFQFDGDFNGDRTVNAIDLARLEANYNKPGNYSAGDANYDGTVNFNDLAVVAARYNRSFPQLASPTNLTVTATTHDQIELTWSAVAGAVYYDVYREGALVGSNINTTTFLDTGLAQSSYYHYMVVAKDASGNTSYPAPSPLLLAGPSPATPMTISPPGPPTANEGRAASLWARLSDSQGWGTHAASIAWGDGTTSTGTVIESGGSPTSTVTVTASHVYPTAGEYFGSITITDPGATDRELFEATIADLPLSASGVPAFRAVTALDAAGTLGAFTDPDPNAAATLYTANIAWGDGFTSAGTITQTGSSFSVSGDHTFANANTYAPVVTIRDQGGASATVTDAIDVDNEPPALTVTGVTSANEGDTYSLTASIGDADASGVSYAWSVSWGDGATDTPTAIPGTFTHVYTVPGSFTVTAAATDTVDGQTYVSNPATQLVSIAEVTPTLSISGDSTISEGDTYVLGGSFSDADGDMPDSWIVAWGDGTPATTYPGFSDAVLDSNDSIGGPAGAEHTYSKGTYTISASAVIEGSTYAAGTQLVTVADATPTFSVIGNATFIKGQPYSVTTGYTDFDSPTGWSIAWGDGVTDSGTGAIPATATHTYTAGTTAGYSITANVTTVDGTYTNLSSVSEAQPTVSLTGATATGTGVPYTLTPSFLDPNGNTATGWVVDFGDGSTASTYAGTATSFSHSYAQSLTAGGGYTIAAYATDADGTFWAAPVTVSVSSDAPTISLSTSDAHPYPGETVTAAVSFTDANSVADAPYGWSIAFGDGTSAYANTSPATLSHVYSQPGTYDVVATGENQNGPLTATSTVTVADATPGFSVSGLASVSQGIAYSLTMNLSDPNISDAAPTYSISWGDGHTDTGPGPVFTHTYLKPSVNTQNISATATIGTAFTLTATSTVSVTNVTPTLAILNNTGEAESGVPTTFTAALADPTTSSASYSVSWGDGTSSPSTTGTPSHSYTFDTTPGATNSYTATMTASVDGTAYTSTQAEQVYGSGAGSIIITDSGSVGEGQTFYLTAVFSDPTQDADLQPNGAAWRISWGDGGTYQFFARSSVTLTASYQYAEEGNYNIEVDGVYQQHDTDSYQCQAVQHDSATVLPGNPSNFVMGVGYRPYDNSVGVSFTFVDYDADVPIYTVAWGDGSTTTGTANQRNFSHTYAYSNQTHSYAITGSGTTDDGTFQANSGVPTWVTILPNWATVSLTGGGIAYEKGQQPAYMSVSRNGGDLTQPLAVALSFGGTEDASEYEAIDPSTGQAINGAINIPAGLSSAEIEVIPLEDHTPEWTDSIQATLQPSSNYDVDPTYNTATVSVANDDLGITLGNGSGNIVLQGSSDGTQDITSLTLDAPTDSKPGATVTLTEPAGLAADVWDGSTQILGNIDGTLVSTYSWAGTAVPKGLQVGGVNPSQSVSDLVFTLTDSDGTHVNHADSNGATVLRLQITMWNDPNGSGDYSKDISDGAHSWLVGQLVDLSATLAGPAALTRAVAYLWNVPGQVAHNISEPADGSTRQVVKLLVDNGNGLVGGQHAAALGAGAAGAIETGLVQSEINFFWVSTGVLGTFKTETVDVSAEGAGAILGRKFRASTDFDVYTPSSEVDVIAGAPGIQYYPDKQHWFVGMVYTPASAAATDGLDSGVTWDATVNTPISFPAGSGVFRFVQLTQSLNQTETLTSAQGGESRTTFPQWLEPASDGGDPYLNYDPSEPYDGALGWKTDNQKPHVEGDSPRSGLDALVYHSISFNDGFKTYLMYLPPGPGSLWVPLRSEMWSFSITVTQNSPGVWTPTGVGMNVPAQFAQETMEPEWTQLVLADKNLFPKWKQ